MIGLDPEVGISTLRLWMAVGAAALIAAAAVLALARPQAWALQPALRNGALLLAAVLGTSLAWMFFDRPAQRDHEADRRSLEMRSEELSVRALAPGSALACLDALAGESVEVACEKALFASPESVAAAVSYAAARVALLSDMVAYEKRGGSDIEILLRPLRRSLETDRFGFLAHALAVRDGCSSRDCKALTLLRDASRVRANLSGSTLDRYIERYATNWAAPAASAAAEPPRTDPSPAASIPPGQRKVVVNIDFPTSASIPPISIMNPEPQPKPGSAAANAPNPSATSGNGGTPRRSRGKQAAVPPPEPANPDPVYLPAVPQAPPLPAPAGAPAPASAPPAPPPVASSGPGPAGNVASGVGAPVQLNPFAAPR